MSMKDNASSKLAMLLALGLMDAPVRGKITHSKIVREVKPAGCDEYFFNINGEFSTVKMIRSEVVFKCFASNSRNAIRKFNKWKNEQ